MTSFTLSTPRSEVSSQGLRQASPLLWRTSMVFLVAFAICIGLTFLDPRLFNGISVWVKPAKFLLSLAVHMLTLCFGIALLPERARTSRVISAVTVTMASMAILEMAYIAFRAARGEASHFNVTSESAALLYQAMGMGAALMMIATAILGIEVLRRAPPSLLGLATGASFLLSAILTLIVGFTLGGMGSHWIGGDLTDATGLPIFGWSTTGGDLRVSHFFGLHLMQALPAVALIGNQKLLAAVALGGIVITFAAYAQALLGLPLLSL